MRNIGDIAAKLKWQINVRIEFVQPIKIIIVINAS